MRDFRNEAKVSHLVRLFRIVTNTYGNKKHMNALLKLEGQEVLAIFPKMGNLEGVLRINDRHYTPKLTLTSQPVSTIIFNVESDEIVPLINDVLRTNANFLGYLKLFLRYLLPKKIMIKGSFFKAILVIRTIMINQHSMYQEEKRLIDLGVL